MKKLKMKKIVFGILALFTIFVGVMGDKTTPIQAVSQTLTVEIPYPVEDEHSKWSVGIVGGVNDLGKDYAMYARFRLSGSDEFLRCMNITKTTIDGATYNASDFQAEGISEDVFKRLGIISSLGKGYKGDNSDEMDWATSIRIWQELHANYPTDPRYLGVRNIHPEIQAKIDIINERLRIYDTDVSFNGTSVELTGYGKEHAVTLTDTNGVFQYYDDVKVSGIHSERSGNSLTLWAEKGDNLSGNSIYAVFMDAQYGTSIFYTSPQNSQELAVVKAKDPYPLNVKYDLTLGSIELSKEDIETGTTPQGYANLDYVKYDVYRTDTNELMGSIEVENGVSTVLSDLPTALNGVPIEYKRVETVSADGYHLGYWKDGELITEENFNFADVETVNNVKEIKDIVNDSVTKIQVHKRDEKGEYQPFNQLQLIDVETFTIIEDWLTTNTYHEIKGLKVGQELILRELREVDGYTRFHDIRFTVNSENEIQVIDVENVPITEFEKPSMKTKATGLNGEKVFDPTIDNVFKDVITRNGYDTSNTYYREADLVCKLDGSVLATVTKSDIVYDTPNGEDEMIFDLKANTVNGCADTYVRERDYIQDTMELYAEHDDPNDPLQSLRFEVPGKPTTPVKVVNTGDVTNLDRFIALSAIAILVVGGYAFNYVRKNKKQSEKKVK